MAMIKAQRQTKNLEIRKQILLEIQRYEAEQQCCRRLIW
jgi:hypothetical protein